MPGSALVGRKVTDADEARRLLEELATSGEPMSSWCAKRGINWYSLCAHKGWPRRKADHGFIEVQTTALVSVPAPTPHPMARYRIRVGERVVEVDGDFDDEVLHRLLRVVAAC